MPIPGYLDWTIFADTGMPDIFPRSMYSPRAGDKVTIRDGDMVQPATILDVRTKERAMEATQISARRHAVSEHRHTLSCGWAWFKDSYPEEWERLRRMPAEEAIPAMVNFCQAEMDRFDTR